LDGTQAAVEKTMIFNPVSSLDRYRLAHADRRQGRYQQALDALEPIFEVTRPELRLDSPRYRKTKGASPTAQAVLEEESGLLVRDLKAMEESYGTDVLTLSISSGYIGRLLCNPAIEQFLQKHHPEILAELRTFASEARPTRPTALAG
jgi:hypothetical protein